MVACPRVSVVMPVFDAEAYLRESIESILGQTYGDFEFLIISEHGTSNDAIGTIEGYSDERIRHIRNARRLGFVGSLNLGLKQARGEYIARMDADDVSLPERIRKQMRFLDEHSDVGIVGTAFEVIDDKGRSVSRHRLPCGPALTKWLLPFRDANVIAHPTAMVRRWVCHVLKGYRETGWAEDYDFWLRASKITRLDNLPEILLRYRVHAGNVWKHSGRYVEDSAAVSEMALAAAIAPGAVSNVVRALVKPYRCFAPTGKDALNAASLLHRACVRYVSSEPMSKRERELIYRDAGNRLLGLSLTCIAKNLVCSVIICRLMVQLCGQQIPWVMASAIWNAIGGVRRKSRIAWRRLVNA